VTALRLQRTPRWLRVLLAGTFAVVLLAGITVASLIGLNAECNGAADECPRSAAYRGRLLGHPVVVLVLLLVGTIWSFRQRTLRPLVLAEASVLALSALAEAIINTPDIGTAGFLATAAVIGWAALRRPPRIPPSR
jgi:hypothetical protein